MAHILRRMGEAALKARRAGANGTIWLPPVLSRRRAMEIRHAWLEEGREWPYEHVVPGVPKNDLPYRDGRQKGHRREVEREERQRRIQEAMAKMPQLIAAYRASIKIPWDVVTPVDKLLLTRRQIREKYVLRKLK